MKSIGVFAFFVFLSVASWAQTHTPDLIPLQSVRLTSPETLWKFVQVLQEVKQRFFEVGSKHWLCRAQRRRRVPNWPASLFQPWIDKEKETFRAS